MRLIQGNGHEFIELETYKEKHKLYVRTSEITGITVIDDVLHVKEARLEAAYGIEGTVPELFSTLGCNTLSEPLPVPF